MNKANLDNLTRGTAPALQVEAPNWDTLKGLVQRAQQSLVDARNDEVSLNSRFSVAYSAAFWLSRVALEACGYRLAGAAGHRVVVFQCLEHTLDWSPDQWRPINDLHRFRNRFDYGDIFEASEAQVEVLINGAQEMLDDILRLFPRTRP